jgi:hypothetical protein
MARSRREPVTQEERELRELVASYAEDPYGFVLAAFRWGEGELAGQDGPDEWQRKFLIDWGDEIHERGFDGAKSVLAIRMAASSGHGVGKSCLVAWIVLFIMSTRPYCRGSITASTVTQLTTKTQPELAKWLRRCICGHWFRLDTTKIVAIESPEDWRADFITARKENSEAFAGQHNATSTSFYIIDEGSGVPDPIYQVAEGGLTDGEPMIFVFGNPTQPTGYFADIFKKFGHRWLTYRIDSRKARMTNKAQIQAWLEDWGEDSDFFRVRVKGEPPGAAAEQLISLDDVARARKRPARADVWEPLVLGVDVARYGNNRSVIAIRKGNDARTHPAQIYEQISTMELAARVVETANEFRADAVFVDGGGIGGAVVDRCEQLGLTVIEVNFGGKSGDREFYDKRSEMWGRLRDAVKGRLAIEDSDELEQDLIAQEYLIDRRTRRTRLVSKEDLHRLELPSPDWGDALALTYAFPVSRAVAEAGHAGAGAMRDRSAAYHPHDALERR